MCLLKISNSPKFRISAKTHPLESTPDASVPPGTKHGFRQLLVSPLTPVFLFLNRASEIFWRKLLSPSLQMYFPSIFFYAQYTFFAERLRQIRLQAYLRILQVSLPALLDKTERKFLGLAISLLPYRHKVIKKKVCPILSNTSQAFFSVQEWKVLFILLTILYP